ncbi:rhodanese-like domain-containing protein [Actinokineospora auranticolor]|uniref:Rhodanese-related sulfurtransferase n=1 Tax=Actinokineospora auranticolor TaxID=155976 RepID=A0A2S6GUI2_9PSEU|nr:rhodanese-like domain-containing protein [Actinokineospora auranticolor]PPK68870.1 rhodanese-related sulfurtransferase [Actinokineospora auranticolor]
MNTEAVAHFTARLTFETDPSDVRAAQVAGTPLVLVDSRSAESWAQGHVAGALHLPTREIAARARDLVPADADVVTYCWGPGCNGGTRAALEFARLGYRVREMIGGFEYWAREGLPLVGAERAADPLTTVVGAGCAC